MADFNDPTQPTGGFTAPSVTSRADDGQPQLAATVQYGGQAPNGGFKMGEETIQIAPHRTTNRFPWAAVENPTVPVYGSMTEIPPLLQAAPLPQPLPPEPEPVLEPQPTPPEAESKVVEIELPTPMDQAISQLESLAGQPAEPTAQPVVEPLPEPTPEPLPAVAAAPSEPPAALLPVEPPLATLPEAPEPELPQPAPEHETAPVIPVPAPFKPPRQHGRRAHPIYSEQTRMVWQVFRPAKLIQFLIIFSFLAVFGGAILAWYMSGAPTNIFDVPAVKSLLQR